MTRAGTWQDTDWAVVVMWFVALNVLDLGLTLHLIARGATEMNPVMAGLLEAGWGYATAFKLIVTLGVALGLWLGRSHRHVRTTGIAFVAIFCAVMVYQLVDLQVA